MKPVDSSSIETDGQSTPRRSLSVEESAEEVRRRSRPENMTPSERASREEALRYFRELRFDGDSGRLAPVFGPNGEYLGQSIIGVADDFDACQSAPRCPTLSSRYRFPADRPWHP